MLDAKTVSNPHLRTADWYKSATRWTQLTLVEDDPLNYDPAEWIEIFKRTKSNATCLSAGGYIAYYPSKIPFHYVSRHLGDTDPFGALVEGARRLDMHVMARVDPHAIHQDAAEAHPEWMMVDKSGEKVRHWSFPDVWVTCAYSSYNFEFMPEVLREITRDYDIDAIFANRWQGHGVCYCETCARNFRDASGYALPQSANAEDPAWRAWAAWRRTVLSRQVVEWDEVMKAIKPHTSYIPNMGSISLMEFDLKLIEAHCPFLCVDDQGRRDDDTIWMSGRDGKRMRATFRDRPSILIASMGPGEAYRWKDSVTTGAETQAWLADGMAHGMRPWFTKFNGVIRDTRWIDPMAEIFGIHAEIEPALAATTPSAEIAIIDPATTLRHHGPETRRRAEADDLGFYHALVEAGLPFELLSDQMMSAEALDRFKVVILANATCLSDAQAETLRAYVGRGGSVIAAFETGTRDESSKPREKLALGELLGVRAARTTRGVVKNKYIAINGVHPVSAGFEGAERIICGTYIKEVEADPDTAAPFLYVPDYPDLPMEEVYPRSEASGAAVVAREHASGGRTIYIPWNIGAIFWEVLAPDHGQVIANSVRWALGQRPKVEVRGHAVLDIAVREADNDHVVTLVNLSNPMMMKGPIRKVYPVGRQVLSVAVPQGKLLGSARMLVRGIPADAKVVDGRVEVDIPGIDLIETVHIRWG